MVLVRFDNDSFHVGAAGLARIRRRGRDRMNAHREVSIARQSRQVDRTCDAELIVIHVHVITHKNGPVGHFFVAIGICVLACN